MELELINLELKFATKNKSKNLFFNSEIFIPCQSYLEYQLLGVPTLIGLDEFESTPCLAYLYTLDVYYEQCFVLVNQNHVIILLVFVVGGLELEY